MKKHMFFVHFLRFFVDFRCEITEKGLKSTKRLKTAEISSLTSFWVCAAPKSWSKYTTVKYEFRLGEIILGWHKQFIHLYWFKKCGFIL